MHPMSARGGCLCGGVRYEIDGALRDVVICHCSRCRRTHGHTGAYAECASQDIVLLAAGALCWYEAAGRARGFCGRCGASVFWRADREDRTSIAAGTLDEPTGLRTVAHIYTASRGDYYVIDADAPHHEASRPD
jgi:hypothetical protein